MVTTASEPDPPYDIGERIRRIDELQMRLSSISAELIEAEPGNTGSPFTIAIVSAIAGATLFAAGAAFMVWIV